MNQRKQSSTSYPTLFLMVDSTDHITGKTGLSPTVTISKNGGSFASPSGAVTELANGWYALAGNATDRGTLGDLLIHAEATGADPVDDRYCIVPWDPFDAVRLGLTALPNAAADAAGGLPISDAGGLDLDTLIGRLDAAISSRLAGTSYTAPDNSSITAILADTNELQTNQGNWLTATGFSTHSAADVWAVASRSLTTFGSLVSDVATAVWGAATRTLTAFGFTPSVTDVTLAASQPNYAPAKAGDAMTLTSAYDAAKTAAPASTALSSAIWTSTKAGYLDTAVSSAPPSAATVAAAVRDVSNASPAVGSLGEAVNSASAPTVGEIDTQLSGTHGSGSWTSSATGTGDTAVSAATTATDGNDLSYKTSGGVGIGGATVIAYLKTDYDAGTFTQRGRTTTKDDGTWAAPLMLNSGSTYVIWFELKGSYGPDTQEVTVP